MTTSERDTIIAYLDEHNVPYEHFTHEEVHTSEDAAKEKDIDLDEGAKSIILKVKGDEDRFVQYVLPGNLRINTAGLTNYFEAKNVSLASPKEVEEVTGCAVGSVPPFGPLFGVESFADESLLHKKAIYVSGGTHTDTIKIRPEDLIDIGFSVVDYAEET